MCPGAAQASVDQTGLQKSSKLDIRMSCFEIFQKFDTPGGNAVASLKGRAKFKLYLGTENNT